MSEHKSPIPSRIYNAAVGGHICGTEDIIDDTKNKTQKQINSEVEESLGTGGSVDSRIASAVATETSRAQEAEADRYTKSETYTKQEVHNLITTPSQEYVSVTATNQTTAVTDVLPATGAADTTYRVGNWDGTQYNDSVFSEYAWNGSAYIKLSTKSQIGEVYDISANHADTKYTDLATALGTNGANIPVSLRKGGMSVKYVQSSDNKYIQARCMSDEFTTDVTQWQGVDDEPISGSENLVKSGGVYQDLADLNLEVGNKTQIANNFSYGGYNTNTGTKINPSQTINRLMRIDLTNIESLELKVGLQTNYFAIAFFDSNDNWLWREGIGDGTEKTYTITRSMFPNNTSYGYIGNRTEITSNPKVSVILKDNLDLRIKELNRAKAEKSDLELVNKQVFDPYGSVDYNAVVGSSINYTTYNAAKVMDLPASKECNLYIDTTADITDYGHTFEIYAYDSSQNLLERFYITKFSKTKKTFSANVSRLGLYVNIGKILSNGVVSIKAELADTVVAQVNSLNPLGICQLNSASDYDSIVCNLFQHKKNAQNTVVLGWISDVHADAIALKRFKEFAKKYGVTSLLSSGDNQSEYYTDDYKWWFDNGSYDIMVEVGNHDAWINNNSDPSIIDYQETSGGEPINLWIVKQSKCYEKYLAPSIYYWTNVSYTADKCYYYKDYKNGNDTILRLIVLDSLHYGKGEDMVGDVSTQETWFAGVLENARQNNIPVIVSTHYWPGHIVRVDCGYNDLDTGGTDYISGAAAVVQSYIDNGGEFIAWLIGHSHFDAIGTIDGYSSQLMIVLGTARYDRNLCSTARVKDTKTQDNFNIVSFDTTEKEIKVVKVGADYNRLLEGKRMLVYRYAEYNGLQRGLVLCNS